MNIRLIEVPVRGFFETLATNARGRVIAHSSDADDVEDGGTQTLVELVYPSGKQVRRWIHSNCIVLEV